MIIKRISEGIRQQDWFVVIVEVMIVVVGIFLGLQVDDWNEEQKDKAREQQYLERLAEDITSDLSAMNHRIRFWKQVSEYGHKGLAYSSGSAANEDTNWDLLHAFFQASQVAELYVKQSTFDELTSAGELSLISDLALRATITDYYNFGAATLVSERPKYREHVRGIIPMEIQSYIWSECFESSSNEDQILLDCAAPVSEMRSKEIIDAIVGDATLMEELRYWISTLKVSEIVVEGRVRRASSLIQLIEAARNRG